MTVKVAPLLVMSASVRPRNATFVFVLATAAEKLASGVPAESASPDLASVVMVAARAATAVSKLAQKTEQIVNRVRPSMGRLLVEVPRRMRPWERLCQQQRCD